MTDVLGRRRIVAEAGGVGRLALGEDLLLDLADLLFEPLDPLFGRRLAALGVGRGEGECGEGGERKSGHGNA